MYKGKTLKHLEIVDFLKKSLCKKEVLKQDTESSNWKN